MASENQFTVDLGPVKLSEAQRTEMTTAIHKAVASQMASFGTSNRIVLVPINKWTGGFILNGIVARPITDQQFKEIVR